MHGASLQGDEDMCNSHRTTKMTGALIEGRAMAYSVDGRNYLESIPVTSSNNFAPTTLANPNSTSTTSFN